LNNRIKTLSKRFGDIAFKAHEKTSFATTMIMTGAGIGAFLSAAATLASNAMGYSHDPASIAQGASFFIGFCTMAMIPSGILGQLKQNGERKIELKALANTFS